jgi:dUTP pyrophosphatase
MYVPGDKIAQLIIMQLPFVDIEEALELSDSNRGEGGFGSTGK